MNTMKILTVTGLTLTTLLILQLIKKKRLEQRLFLVAEEGYETAEDILFPKRKYLQRRQATSQASPRHF